MKNGVSYKILPKYSSDFFSFKILLDNIFFEYFHSIEFNDF
ncbi:hypothetical protein SAMN05421789_10192 [Kaistella chaponensis]|uniref:Uncharacterized protein n=1 Tax=Kaistella chaponensis TaxID=713588 RepID=A0A1N7J4N4_9FLAO|nr:hypothetical protein SAMN05421789_10192 [Kaistella chaponensis]